MFHVFTMIVYCLDFLFLQGYCNALRVWFDILEAISPAQHLWVLLDFVLSFHLFGLLKYFVFKVLLALNFTDSFFIILLWGMHGMEP